MGRAKRRLELLSNKKERLRTFERRLKGLKKQVHELITLCNIEACLIVDNVPILEKDNHPMETLQYWPSDFANVSKLIACHRNQPADNHTKRSNLASFYEAQNRKIEEEIIELKKNKNDDYPTWDDSYNLLSKELLEEFGGLIGQKIQFLRTRMENMRNSSRSSIFQKSEPLRDGEYFQKEITARNELCFHPPVSCVEPETGNSCHSAESQVYFGNPMSNLLIENDPWYDRLENLCTDDFLNGLMDLPLCDNYDNFGSSGYLDLDAEIVSKCSQDLETNNEWIGESLSADSDEFFYLLGE